MTDGGGTDDGMTDGIADGGGTHGGMADGGGTHGMADSGGTDPDAAAPSPGGPPPLLLRLLRSRTARAVTAAGLVGALLGAGTVAWRTDTLPLLSSAPCWGAFDDALTTQVFGDLETSAETQRLRTDPRARVASYGQCRVTSYQDDGRAARQLTVRVHELSGTSRTAAKAWTDDFLQPGMVAMGNGLPGMASGARAWLALPQSCTGEPDLLATPTVVDLTMGEADIGAMQEYERKDRRALSAAAVAVTNKVLRERGCSGTYSAPERTDTVVAWDDTDPAALCGIKGLRLPTGYRERLPRTRVGPDGGAARVCEAGSSYPPGELRLTTVVDPVLAHVFALEASHGGTPLRGGQGPGPGGFGAIDVTRGVYVASCQTGDVVFLVERLKDIGDAKARETNLVRSLLPRYVEAEAERIGCGPIRLTLPDLV
ncbi:hypothetical protein ACIQPT_21285 [Streptomyces sp. NPDC091289]|uniref:hypothetical protein n=1 Tax=Streptomyces sp. NPDC091289 TaxID=3365989 RepID=UPI00380D8CE7